MRKSNSFIIPLLIFVVLGAGCSLFKKMQKSTFSLNGGWEMVSTTDNNALLGSLIKVSPETGDAVLTNVKNNTYCVRPTDIIWRDIVSVSSGFTVNNLCNSCVSSLEYRPAVIGILTKDSISVAGVTRSGAALVQTWKRVATQ